MFLKGFGPSFSCVVHTWGLHLKGPVYVSIFKPFAVVIAACMGVAFLGDDLHLGWFVFTTLFPIVSVLVVMFYDLIWLSAFLLL